MMRARQPRRVMAALVAASLVFALAACDSTPPMIRGVVTLDGNGAPAAGLVVTAYADGSETPVATATVAS